MLLKSTAITAALIGAIAASPALAGDVEIVLDQVRGEAGALYVSLQTEEQFLKEEGIVGEIIDDPQAGTVTVRFTDVPEGAYSFTAWHDIDRDGQFTMGARGPLDGWAMVGAAQLRGEPVFAEQSFTVGQGTARVRETMIYPAQER